MTAMTFDEALAMMAEAFDEPVQNLAPGVARTSVRGWDSMGALMLIAEIDERFGLELPAEESRGMKQISDVLDFMRRHGVLAE
jgi:acyl carrier protein